MPATGSPATSFVWKARPVFLSSTFRDMHAERDHLREHAFKALAEKLRDRCHYLDTIDLRQGVESTNAVDEAARETLVLKVCLDEIQRSRPFLVALLGDRYGWIPPADRMIAAARSAGLSEFVDVAGRSVTELEILFGVLENHDQRSRSWFYFRTLDRTGLPPEVASRFPAEEPSVDPASPAGRLRMLKERIRREMPSRVRDYTLRWDSTKRTLTGLETLDAHVERDLWSDLDTETAAYLRTAPRTWQEADARGLADFAAERIRGNVERPAITGPMLEHALSPELSGTPPHWCHVLTGESGAGKSCLFATAYQALRIKADEGQLILLAHAAGIFPQSGQVDRMLRRWVTQLAEYLGQADPLEKPEPPPASPEVGVLGLLSSEALPVTSDEIQKAFASLLGQAASRIRVVVLIDALNQFEPTPRARHLTWLPRLWPANSRFLATAIPGSTSAALAARPGTTEARVPSISPDEARSIAERFYHERHHRDSNPRVIDILLSKTQPDGSPAHGNPLWLALALQEMNLLEADDFDRAEREFFHLTGAQRMEALQLAEAAKLSSDVAGVYGELLARAERYHGCMVTRAIVDLIALGRSGWRESDLRAVVPAITGRPWDEVAFAGVRRALGVHLVQSGTQAQWNFPHTILRDTVIDRQLSSGSDRRRLHGILADHLLALSNDPLRMSETMVHIYGHGDREKAKEYLAPLIAVAPLFSTVAAELTGAINGIVEIYCTAKSDTECDEATDWISSLMVGGESWRCVDMSSFIGKVGSALAFSGAPQAQRAQKILLDSAHRTIREQLQEFPNAKGYVPTFFESLLSKGELLRQRSDLHGALQAFSELVASAEKQIVAQPESRYWLHYVSIGHCGIGHVRRKQGELQAALQSFRTALPIAQRLVDAYPKTTIWLSDISVCYQGIGDVLRDQGDLPSALKAFRDALGIEQRLAETDPANSRCQRDLSVSHSSIGHVLCNLGDLPSALTSFKNALSITQRLVDSDPANALWEEDLVISLKELARTSASMGESRVAADYFGRCHATIRSMQAKRMQLDSHLIEDLEILNQKANEHYAGLVGSATTAGRAESVFVPPAPPPPPKDLLLIDLLATAEQSFLKGNLDAAMTMFGKALDQGTAAADLASNWVACVLGLFPNTSIPPLHMTKANAILEKLVAEGQQSLAADLDRQIQSHQQAAVEAAKPKKPRWKIW